MDGSTLVNPPYPNREPAGLHDEAKGSRSDRRHRPIGPSRQNAADTMARLHTLPGAFRAVTMQPRHVRRGAAWALLVAAALAFKAFVPLLAAVAAQMQGKEVADICSIYGVRLPGAHAHAQGGAHVHTAGMAMPAIHDGDPSPGSAPGDHSSHAQDHCALTGLAACAVFALALWDFVDWDGRVPTWAVRADGVDPAPDPSARWLTLRLHAPPSPV
jgi:hypothetical protein